MKPRELTSGLILLLLGAAAAWAAPKDSCFECHSALDGKLGAPASKFRNDVHARAGFSCADCHGGDRTSDDPSAAMDRSRGFVGAIARTAVAKTCARCHSDATVMHKYRPQQNVDQYAQYQTSVHGKRMAAGDTAVATCIDCHSVHNIREVKDALSPVHPLRLPDTCGRCHKELADYRQSVHWDAVSKRGDLSAPTCASCHGNHGATPPQVSSVADVCGSCHALVEDLYNKSPHRPAFAAMGASGCVTCHSNHAVKKPGLYMLAGSKAVCSQCHEPDSAGGKAAAEMAGLIGKLSTTLDASDEVLGRAQRSGMEVSDAVAKQQEGREALVKARVAVHEFRPEGVAKTVNGGLKLAAETRAAGEHALKERDNRRIGLGVALIAIALTILGLWLALRSIESRGPAVA